MGHVLDLDGSAVLSGDPVTPGVEHHDLHQISSAAVVAQFDMRAFVRLPEHMDIIFSVSGASSLRIPSLAFQPVEIGFQVESPVGRHRDARLRRFGDGVGSVGSLHSVLCRRVEIHDDVPAGLIHRVLPQLQMPVMAFAVDFAAVAQRRRLRYLTDQVEVFVEIVLGEIELVVGPPVVLEGERAFVAELVDACGGCDTFADGETGDGAADRVAAAGRVVFDLDRGEVVGPFVLVR